MNVRLKRLYADHQQVTKIFGNHPNIRLIEAIGTPPERYIIEFLLNGLTGENEEEIAIINSHRAEIYLTLDYPRRPPFCRMLTPIFHPNINPQKICIGDHWNAGQALTQLIIRIGEMICFQSFNVQSPLNAKAAVWAEKNISSLPLDRCDLQKEIC